MAEAALVVTVNGESKRVERGTVRELLGALGYPERGVAVERNRRVVPHAELTETAVADGDVFEVVSLVGGG
ncbi:MAG: sulfur carrier protein ThiS [Planctomycetota bacterium]